MNPGVEHPEESVFKEAERIIYGDREQVYGDPSKNLSRIAELWTSFLQERLRMAVSRVMNLTGKDVFTESQLRAITEEVSLYLTPTHVCRMMQLLKFARDENSPKRDNVVDDIGYAGLVHRIRETSLQDLQERNVEPNITFMGKAPPERSSSSSTSSRKAPRKR